MSTKKMKIITLMIILFLIVGYVFGYFSGFFWEHIILKKTAMQYILKKYNVSTTVINSYVSFKGEAGVWLYSDKYDCSFAVTTGRRSIERIDSYQDNFLNRLTENKLKSELEKQLSGIIGSNDKTAIHIEKNISNLSDINAKYALKHFDPGSFIGRYTCQIYFNDIDYEQAFRAFNAIRSGKPRPIRIEFEYYTKKNVCIAECIIKEPDYDKIKSKYDIKTYFNYM